MLNPISLFAWTTRLPDGSTSLVGTIINGLYTPLISMSLDRTTAMKPLALSHADASGQPVYLERFDYCATLDTIEAPDA